MNRLTLLGSVAQKYRFVTPVEQVIVGGRLFNAPNRYINNQIQHQEQAQPELPIEAEQGEIELTAVPKKRVSYTRNRKRNSSKKYENIHNYTVCQKCHSPVLMHCVCMVCIRKKL
ncbi:hypothetical protein CYY_000916 [Polysphondylium violaceum]|uniref:Large ribosomal subunit protein bL32m n=1 Tax=Polysphondylium violaceum TaxID=133409 RepID=A0A8J4Q1Z4_9MYCE|nr:hypothetical protein CYY_000916 [Polysphondylium violaceum]